MHPSLFKVATTWLIASLVACQVVPADPPKPDQAGANKPVEAKAGNLQVLVRNSVQLLDRVTSGLHDVTSLRAPAERKTFYGLMQQIIAESGIGRIVRDGDSFSYRAESKAGPVLTKDQAKIFVLINGHFRDDDRVFIDDLGLEIATKEESHKFQLLVGTRDETAVSYTLDFASLNAFFAAMQPYDSTRTNTAVIDGILTLLVTGSGSILSADQLTVTDSGAVIAIENLRLESEPGSRQLKSFALTAKVSGEIAGTALQGNIKVDSQNLALENMYAVLKDGTTLLPPGPPKDSNTQGQP